MLILRKRHFKEIVNRKSNQIASFQNIFITVRGTVDDFISIMVFRLGTEVSIKVEDTERAGKEIRAVACLHWSFNQHPYDV